MQSEVLFKSVHANWSNQPTSQTFLKWDNFVNICLIELKLGKPDLHPHIELQTSLTSLWQTFKQVPHGYNDASSSSGRTDGRTYLLGRFESLSL